MFRPYFPKRKGTSFALNDFEWQIIEQARRIYNPGMSWGSFLRESILGVARAIVEKADAVPEVDMKERNKIPGKGTGALKRKVHTPPAETPPVSQAEPVVSQPHSDPADPAGGGVDTDIEEMLGL